MLAHPRDVVMIGFMALSTDLPRESCCAAQTCMNGAGVPLMHTDNKQHLLDNTFSSVTVYVTSAHPANR